jgi:hypothetical protein
MLGHASAAMTQDRYGHPMPGQADEIARLLSAAALDAASDANGSTVPGQRGLVAVRSAVVRTRSASRVIQAA